MKSLIMTFASLVLAACSAIWLTSAAEAQRTINDCEKIQAADAYNQCLAKFGPPAKSLNVESPRAGDVKSGSEEAAVGAGPAKGRVSGRRHGRGRYTFRRGRAAHPVSRGGRKRMTISVGR